MDEPIKLATGLWRLTVNVDTDDVGLFEGLWPVPDGVSLHAYLVRGTRSVLVDPWDEGGYGPEEVEADLAALGLSWSDLSAVAFTKTPRPDFIARLRAHQPDLEDWGRPEAGVEHDLGGAVLEERGGFWFASPANAVLSGDAFAGLGWMDDEVWAEDLGEHAGRLFDDEALRWFASRPLVPVALPAGTAVVAPAHGCAWGRNPQGALDRARKFASWVGEALDEVTVVWPEGVAYQPEVDALVGGVLDEGAGLNLFRLPGDDPTALAAGARRASLVVVEAGLDSSFLAGLDKSLWRPSTGTPVEALRSGMKDRL